MGLWFGLFNLSEMRERNSENSQSKNIEKRRQRQPPRMLSHFIHTLCKEVACVRMCKSNIHSVDWWLGVIFSNNTINHFIPLNIILKLNGFSALHVRLITI